MKWYFTLAVAVYAILVFQSAVLVTSSVLVSYLAGKCQHFDYNDHATITWDWWQQTCPLVVQ